jgi:hypothetical protein
MWRLLLRACCILGIHRQPPVPTHLVIAWRCRDCGAITHRRAA